LDLTTHHKLRDLNWSGQTFGFDLLMINDQDRNKFYESALIDVQGKTVLDIGAGTGLLSAMAVAHGAKKVYSFERDWRNYEHAKQFINQAGLSNKIELICADILSVDQFCWPHDEIDCVITETFANDCFIENFAFLVEHVEKHFNLALGCKWIPEKISLNIGVVDVAPTQEFDPGVVLPTEYQQQIETAIHIYRDHFYHKHDELNMPVAQIPRINLDNMQELDQFPVNQNLRDRLDSSKYEVCIPHLGMKNPYIKIDWNLCFGDHKLELNRVESWRSIAFKVDPAKSDRFYFRFNPYSHALIGTQF
jgi:predicted RNA methylase